MSAANLCRHETQIEQCLYRSSGELDGYPATLFAWAEPVRNREIVLEIGAFSLGLSAEAAAELARHLQAAVECVQAAQGGEV